MRIVRPLPILLLSLGLVLPGSAQESPYFRFNTSTLAVGQSGGSPTPATNNDPVTGLSVTVPCTGCSTRVRRGYVFQPTANKTVSGWALQAGHLPAGLQLDQATGGISGAAQVEGTYTFVLSVAQPGGSTMQAPLVRLAVKPLPALSYASSTWNAGQAVSVPPTLTDAVGPGTFDLTAGALPTGLALDRSTGVISGPAGTSVTGLKVTYTDSDGASVESAAFDILVTTSPLLQYPGSAYSGRVGASFPSLTPRTFALAASPNIRVSGGSLPTGLRVDPTSGTISGTPSVSGNYAPVTLAANAANGSTVTSNALSFTIGQPSVSYQGISGQVGKPLSLSPTVAFLNAPQFSLNSGSLPAGVGIAAADGTISGTPTVSGTFPVTVLAYEQSLLQAVSPSFSLSIAPATMTLTPSTGAVSVTEGSAVAVSATSSFANPTWSVTGNPPWMTFTQSGGTYATSSVSADVAPSAPQSYNVTLTASDASGATTSSGVSVQVNPATVNVGAATVRAGAAFSVPVSQGMGVAGTWTATASPADVPLSGVSNGSLTGSAPANGGTAAVTRSLSATYTASVAPSVGAAATASGQGTLTVHPLLGVAAQPDQSFYSQAQVNLAAPAVVGKVGSLTWALRSGSSDVTTTLGQTCAGLGFSTATGAIAGKPTASCSASLTYVVTDSGDGAGIPVSSAASQPFNLSVAAGVVTASVPRVDVQEGQVVSFTATTNLPNPTWSLAGTPPAWMTVTSSGGTATVNSVSGDVQSLTTYTPTLVATGGGTSASSPVTVAVSPATSSIASPAPVHGGQPFSAGLSTGMTSPGSWTVSSVAADIQGLAVSGSSLVGTAPANAGTVPVTRTLKASYVASAAPSSGAAAAAPAPDGTLTVYPPPSVSVVNSISAVTRTTLTMIAPTANYTVGTVRWSTPSTLPNGVTIDATSGKLVGSPTQAGTFPVTFVATDSDGTTGSAASTLTVTSSDAVLAFTNTIGGVSWSNGVAWTLQPNPVTCFDCVNYSFILKNTSAYDAAGLTYSLASDAADTTAFVFYDPNTGVSSATYAPSQPWSSSSTNCGTTLPAGKTCSLGIAYRPKRNGTNVATVQVNGSNASQPVGFTATGIADKLLPAGRMFVYASDNVQTVQFPVSKMVTARYMLVGPGMAGVNNSLASGGDAGVVISGWIQSTNAGTVQAFIGKGQTVGGSSYSQLRASGTSSAAQTALAQLPGVGQSPKVGVSAAGGRTDTTYLGSAQGYGGGSGTPGLGNVYRGTVSGAPYYQDLWGGRPNAGSVTFNQTTWSYGAGGHGGGTPVSCGNGNVVVTGSGGGGGIVFDGNVVDAGARDGVNTQYGAGAGKGYGAGGGGGTLGYNPCPVLQTTGGQGGDSVLYLEWDAQ